MRSTHIYIAEYAKHFSIEQACKAMKNLTAFAPQTAGVERDGVDTEVQWLPYALAKR